MSILLFNENGWVISHYEYSKILYKNVQLKSKSVDFAYNRDLFKINSPFLMDQEAKKLAEGLSSEPFKKKFKKKHKEGISVSEEIHFAQQAYKTIVEEARKALYFCFVPGYSDLLENNAAARSFVNSFYLEEANFPFIEGVNDSTNCQMLNINNKKFLVPPNTAYYCCDVASLDSKLNDKNFDFILLDPPWQNKHIRRKKKHCSSKGYEMVESQQIINLPIKTLLNDSGLVGIWCTNAPKHIESVKAELFPKWGVKYTATWLWIKVTQGGEPVTAFETSSGKKPYERIIFGACCNRTFKNPEESKVILSVPSAIHSHKPPITDIMKNYLPENPSCLELFARYLLPRWTSVGNQVFSLQSMSLFEQIDST